MFVDGDVLSASQLNNLVARLNALTSTAARRDDAVQLVLATLGAAPDAQIVLLPDGCGEVVTTDKKALSDAARLEPPVVGG